VDESERYQRGMAVRRAVLGDDWVNRANSRLNDFNREFQDLITRYAWGEIWRRPGLDRKTRSCMVLSMTIARGAWDEFRLHVRGALSNGLGRDEIKEVILQATIYCGLPAANTAFHHAEAVLSDAGA
jgi:4-carboxymuconolactone decarboxylase